MASSQHRDIQISEAAIHVSWNLICITQFSPNSSMFPSLLLFHPVLPPPPPSLLVNSTIFHVRMLLKLYPESQDYSWQIQHGMLPHPYCYPTLTPAHQLHVGSPLHYSLWYIITFLFLWLFTATQSPWSLNFSLYSIVLHTLLTTMTPNIFMPLNCLPKKGISLSLCWTSQFTLMSLRGCLAANTNSKWWKLFLIFLSGYYIFSISLEDLTSFNHSS